MRILIAVCLCFMFVSEGSRAAETKPNPGLVMWSAFKCSTYAELSNQKDEQARLFKVGYAAGETFVNGVMKKTIPDAEVKSAPWQVLLLLQGPTAEFMIGRVFESASNDAFDAVVKKDAYGLPLESSQWHTDDKTKAMIAGTKYNQSNCNLIR